MIKLDPKAEVVLKRILRMLKFKHRKGMMLHKLAKELNEQFEQKHQEDKLKFLEEC